MPNVDLMHGLMSNLLSMGKLMRMGWEFHFTDSGCNCWAAVPGAQIKVAVELGDDDIVRLPHSICMRSGKSAQPVPVLAFNKRHMPDLDSVLVHVIFNHSSGERIYQTLRVTKGYKAARLAPCNDIACSIANARSCGLRHTASVVYSVCAAPVGDSVHGEGVDPERSDDEDMADVQLYTAEVAGRELGVQPVPRFDLQALRPFEAMFVDNKNFPCPVRGGAKTTLNEDQVKG